MMRLKTASLAILGTAAIVLSVLASPAMAEGTTAKGTMKGTMAKGTMAKSEKYTQAQTKGSQTLAKGQRHMQRCYLGILGGARLGWWRRRGRRHRDVGPLRQDTAAAAQAARQQSHDGDARLHDRPHGGVRIQTSCLYNRHTRYSFSTRTENWGV